MNAPHTSAPPLLIGIKWISSRCRDGRIVVDARYAVNGNYVYKRVDGPFGFVYCRGPIKAVIDKTYWSDIPDTTWQQCDAFGFPLFKDLERVMDLTLLSPEVQAVIASADIDKICDMCERVRGRDGLAYRVLQDVAEALRNWSDFEVERGPDGITEGAQLMIVQASKRGLVLPLNRAKELVRLVFLFKKSFGFDPDEFFNWLLDQTLAASSKNSRGGHA